jgi:hypothetical protein
MSKDIIQCILDSGFYIKARPSDGGTKITLDFPESNIFERKIPAESIEYSIVEEGVDVKQPTGVIKNIKCSDYAKRIVVWALILRRCSDMQVYPDTILIEKEEGGLSLANEIISVLVKPKNTKKESFLAEVLVKYLMGNDEYENAVQLGVPKNYKLLVNILCGE